MYHAVTRHHLIAKSKGWSNHYNNLIRLKEPVHQAIHTLFWNELPHQQIGKILDINENALNRDFVLDIEEFLQDRTVEEIYNKKCYIKRILFNKQ